MTARFRFVAPAIALVALVTTVAPAGAQYGATNGEWSSYAGDNGGTKYSPLDQIDAGNFSSLEIVWRVPTPDGQLDFEAITKELVRRGRLGGDPGGSGNPDYGLSLRLFKATPLMVGGLVFVPTPLSLGAAYDAGTGEERWVHDPESYLDGPPASRANMRGAAYWTDGNVERVYWGTTDGYLVSVDARTGEPAVEFGDNGRVDLFTGVPRAERGTYDHRGRHWISVTSPPIVSNGVVVTPVTISDYSIAKEAPPGWVKGIDAITGDLRWVFRTVPRGDDFGAETWGNESWRYSGNTNVWAAMSADDELGYVYLPTSTPTSDYYGGHRPGDNLFAESIVAVDIRTGERKWHFQAVHHGVWDYDFPTHSNLVNVTVDGREVKALAQVSKQGFTYVFDRETGEPVWPIEERPVETDTNLEGEVLSATQPFPTKPPPFEYQGISIDDLVDFTPEIRAMAVDAVKDFRLGPLFTPPMNTIEGGIQGTIQRPAIDGGANLQGSGVDPETGLLYVPSNNSFSVLKYYTPDPDAGGNLRYSQSAFGSGRQPRLPQGLPLFKPPYSRMTAIDLNAGDTAWMQPNGNGDRYRNHPQLRDLNLPPLGGDGRGGPVITKTLLISALTAGGSDGGPRLIARDKATGEVVGSVDLPAGALGTPMTYLHGGRQFVGLTIGGETPELIALAVPEGR